jgi:hypothetical protein
MLAETLFFGFSLLVNFLRLVSCSTLAHRSESPPPIFHYHHHTFRHTGLSEEVSSTQVQRHPISTYYRSLFPCSPTSTIFFLLWGLSLVVSIGPLPRVGGGNALHGVKEPPLCDCDNFQRGLFVPRARLVTHAGTRTIAYPDIFAISIILLVTGAGAG